MTSEFERLICYLATQRGIVLQLDHWYFSGVASQQLEPYVMYLLFPTSGLSKRHLEEYLLNKSSVVRSY